VITMLLAQKLFAEPLLPIAGTTIDLTPFVIMFTLLTAGSIVMRLRLVTSTGTLGLKAGRLQMGTRASAIIGWSFLWMATGWLIFSQVSDKQRPVWIIFYVIFLVLLTYSYLLPLLIKTDSRQRIRTTLQSVSFTAFVIGLHPCACMVRDFIRGLGHVNENNTQAFQYMSLVITVFAFGLAWGRVFCGWVCPIGYTQEIFTSIPRALGRLGSRIGLLPENGLSDAVRRNIRFGCAAAILIGVLALYLYRGPANHRFVQGFMVFWLMGLLMLTMLSVVDPKWEMRLRNIRYVAITLFCTIVIIGVYMYAAFCVLFTNTFDVVTLLLLGGLLVTTMILSQAWCRFLCPEGAVLSLLTRVSGWKINLDKSKCVSCNTCNTVCPVEAIDLGKVDEGSCLYCCNCVDNCPTDALEMANRPSRSLVELPVITPGLSG